MNEWVERLVLCKQWLRQNEEQLLTGGGWWIRKGAKRGLEVQKGGVIGRNHSFPGGRQDREDATKMPLSIGKDMIIDQTYEKILLAFCV